jgi:hypothetical protein
MRLHSTISGVTACLLLLGCSGGGPTVLVDTPMGAQVLYSPGPVMPNGLPPPPPGLDAALPTPGQIVDRSGSYAGTAVPLSTAGGSCISTVNVKGFHVHGNSVRFGGFRGRIDANNGLQMAYGQNWIVGQFEGPVFYGQIDFNGRGAFGPGCTYALTLQRIGP